MTTYINPRTEAAIDGWPSGKHRVTANFLIERNPNRGERAVRITTGKPKTLTFAHQVRIVDGDDGRIYLAHNQGWAVMIMRGTMDVQHELIPQSDPRFADVMALFQAE